MTPGVAGVNIPHIGETMREVLGVPVVVRVRPMAALDVHRTWGRFSIPRPEEFSHRCQRIEVRLP